MTGHVPKLHNRLPREVLPNEQGDMAEMPKRPIAASDDCFKRDKKHRLLKAQGTGGSQFNGSKYTPYGLFYFHFISSPFFHGHRFFLGGFESTSSAKSFLLRHIIDVDSNNYYRIHNYAHIFLIKYRSAYLVDTRRC